MPRIRFELPESYLFSTDVQVYISHVNKGGHLDHAQLLTLVSEGRVRFFSWLGYGEAESEGARIVVADLVAQYKSEAFHGETLVVAMQPADFNRYGFDLVFRLSEKSSGREVARGKTGIVFVGAHSPAPTAVPPAFLARMQQAQAVPA